MPKSQQPRPRPQPQAQAESDPEPKPQPAPTESAAVTGASLMIGLSVGSRIVTFIANQLLLRYLTASLLGIAAQLEVYCITVLFFARESLRVAIQRQGATPASAARPGQHHQAVVNLGYIALALGALLSVGLARLYSSSVADATRQTPFFDVSLRIYAGAALLELLSEPVFVLMQIRLQYATRATAESVATFLRCATTFTTAVVAHRAGSDLGVLPFALGQLVYAVALLLVYLWAGLAITSKEDFSLLPRRIDAPNTKRGGKTSYLLSYFYRPTVSLATSMMAQNVVKQVLTQGDAFLISIWSTPHAQGIYTLANNYGGLLARLVLQPIEESSRAYFSRQLASASKVDKKTDKRAASPSKDSAKNSVQYIQMLLRIYVLLSAVVMAVGPVGAPALLALVAGSSWTREGAGEVLAVYCYYIPLLALNGITEALVASVATEAQVHRQSAWMTLFSLIFAAAGYLCLVVFDLGASGLVYANCINMACRIAWSLSFVRTYFDKIGAPFSMTDLQPNALTALVVAVTPRLVRRLTRVTARSPGSIVNVAKVAVTAVPFVMIV
ncbi:Rft protein-domain-containing protein [Plectosphaerella cucumerina]|uniref:Man(5)GlcNAc(2)-PP-dolichol translocation protein RFT1 n=1 Tax=Plectosphaerella cucumerina TaxID=40658 RepID=A0A8K0TES9_9PEZI|nr:Rft protein-domain-containing protein [Plectosphaerella cucumerina]